MKRNIYFSRYNTSSTNPTETSTEINHNKFSNLLKKITKKKNIHGRNNIKTLNKGQYKTDSNALNELEEEEKETKLRSQKYFIKILDSHYSSLFQRLKSEVKLPENEKKIFYFSPGKKIKYGFEQFNKTKYINKECMKEFFNKYQKFNILNRKEPIIKYTPSFAFIQSSKEEKIVPNPLGLLRRGGSESILQMNFQKVGDDYSKALSKGLKYKEGLNSIELSSNRLTSVGTSFILKSINNNNDLLSRIINLDLSYNKIGKNDISDLINYIENVNCNLENLNLFSNSLGDENIIKITESIIKYGFNRMEIINFGKNNISDFSILYLAKLIEKCQYLRILNFSGNSITNYGGTVLFKKLRYHRELKVLDLSWNIIGNDFTRSFSYEELVNLNLHNPEKKFSNFTVEEALKTSRIIFRRNPLLPPLDQKVTKQNSKDKDNEKDKKNKVSQIKISELKKINEPQKKPTSFALELGNYFKEKNLSLIHLDISHNNLSKIDCEYLSKEIKDNHSILGIHVDGNEMYIDALGFLHPLDLDTKNEKYYSGLHLSYDFSTNYEMKKTKIDNVRKLRSINHCWICDCYREIEFIFIPKEPILDQQNHIVKIHLDFDNYKPFDMFCLGDKFHIIRMCPPGEIKYFFTVDTIPVENESDEGNNIITKLNSENYFQYTFDSEYMEELNNIRAKISFEKRQERERLEKELEEKGDLELNLNDGYEEEEEENEKNENVIYSEPNNDKITITIKSISTKKVKPNHNVITENYIKNIKFSEPRPLKIINRFIKPRTPWTFPISIWAYYDYEYEGDSEEYLDQCFDFDFKRCQFHKDFKDDNDYNELKQLLRKRYRDIIDCYKYYASISGLSLWQITQNVLTEFISKCNGMCDKTYDINNIYLTEKVVCSNAYDLNDRKKNNNKNLNENNIVRHQFMNLLVKSAKDKYITCLKTTNNILEATKMTFEKHYDSAIKGFEYHNWRKERYYNEQVDNFLKAHLPLLDALYLSWAKQKGPRKKDVWMTCDEFNTLIQSFVDINEYPVRDIPLIFNYSIKLQINEIYSDKHLNMLLPEFLEGLCRAIDKASPIPPGDSNEDWPKEKRVSQPLINKLENIIGKLVKLITHPDFKVLKEKFQMPVKDMNTNLYVYNYDNPFYAGYIIKFNDRNTKRKTTRVGTKHKTGRQSTHKTHTVYLDDDIIDEADPDEEKATVDVNKEN